MLSLSAMAMAQLDLDAGFLTIEESTALAPYLQPADDRLGE